MRIVTTDQMRLIEMKDVEDGRYSSDDLSVLGALALQNQVVQDNPKTVLVLCGENTNGNYGFTLASLLVQNTAIKAEIVYLGSEDNRYFASAKRVKLPVYQQLREIKTAIENSSYIVDCLAGCDLDQMIEYPLTYVIECVNKSNAYVLSCDMPSGLDGNDGSIFGSCIAADCTIALQLPKVGCFLKPGSEYVGKLIVEPIGLSYDAVSAANNPYYCLDEDSVDLPFRGQYQPNRALVCLGPDDAAGKAVIMMKAMLQSGISEITAFVSEEASGVIINNLLEVDLIKVSGDYRQAVDLLDLDSYDEIVLSCQSASQKGYQHLVRKCLQSQKKVTILYEACKYLSECTDLLKRDYPTTIILEPQEYAKTFGYQQAGFLQDLTSLTRRNKTLRILYLQQYPICADGENLLIATSPLVMKAGFREVLAGLVTGLSSQRDDGLEAGLYCYLKVSESHRKTALMTAFDYRQLFKEVIEKIKQL